MLYYLYAIGPSDMYVVLPILLGPNSAHDSLCFSGAWDPCK